MNGITIVVPDNTLATLPSIAVAWGELFTPDGAPNLPRLGQVSWEASVRYLWKTLLNILCVF